MSVPETVYWNDSPRNDCATECSVFKNRRANLTKDWSESLEAQQSNELTVETMEKGLCAIRGLQQLMTDSWECPGRMDLAQSDQTTPCRNLKFE